VFDAVLAVADVWRHLRVCRNCLVVVDPMVVAEYK
jgi:hypothetical protein